MPPRPKKKKAFDQKIASCSAAMLDQLLGCLPAREQADIRRRLARHGMTARLSARITDQLCTRDVKRRIKHLWGAELEQYRLERYRRELEQYRRDLIESFDPDEYSDWIGIFGWEGAQAMVWHNAEQWFQDRVRDSVDRPKPRKPPKRLGLEKHIGVSVAVPKGFRRVQIDP